MFLKSILLFVSVAFVLPSSSMASNNEVKQRTSYNSNSISSQKIINPGKKLRILNYNTYIFCQYFENTSPLTQGEFYIFRHSDNQRVGQILLQYYPQGGYCKTAGNTPTLRLRDIEINENYRRQYHATQALETLFVVLRKASTLPKETEVWLEYSSFYPYLTKLYHDFGFAETNEASFGETKVLKVKLNSTKFPYYKKAKEN